MAYRIYRSDDPGAIAAGIPILPRDPSADFSTRTNLVQILDACLVNGYSGKAPAGWSKPFPSNGTRDIYLSNSSSGFALRVEPTQDSPTSARATNVVSAVVSPTSLTHPNSGQTLIGTGTGSGGAWIVLADEKTFMILSKGDVSLNTSIGLWQLCYFGEVVPFNGASVSWACVGRSYASNYQTNGAPWSSSVPSTTAASNCNPRILAPSYSIDSIRIVGGQFFLSGGSAQYQVPLSATGGNVLANDVILTGSNSPFCKLRGIKSLESAFYGGAAQLDTITLDGKKYAIINVRADGIASTSNSTTISMFLVEVE